MEREREREREREIFETIYDTDDLGLSLAKSSHNQIIWSVGRGLKFCQTTKFKILLADHISFRKKIIWSFLKFEIFVC
jgi:hypothetical protein